MLDPGPTPPSATDPRWQSIELPDRWRQSRPGVGGQGWYRFEVTGVEPQREPWALLLPEVNMNAQARVNGVSVGSGGSFEEPVAHNFNRPLLFVFPGELLEPGRNVIDVRLHAYAHHYGALGPIEVGPERALRQPFELRHLVQVQLAQLGTIVACATSVLVALLWLGTRRDAVYGTFALATGAWAVTSFNYWVRDIPVAHWTWERGVNLGVEWFVVLLAVWAHRLEGRPHPRIERGLFAFATGATLLAWLLPVPLFYAVVNPLHVASFAIGSYAAIRAVLIRDWFATWERVVYGISGLLALSFAGHDVARQFGFVAAIDAALFHLVAPLMLLSFGSTVMARFVRSLEQVRQQHLLAEERVREKTGALERNHARLRSLERDRAVARERERIMHEMHDGLGAQLVSALAMVESGSAAPERVAEALRSALADMRAVIDSLDPGVSDLGVLLGIFRGRIDPLLEASGVRLRWNVGELPDDWSLGAESSLQVMRILQEVVTNAVTHGGAREISLETRCDEACVAVLVADDGSGFDPDSVREGRGLGNMRRRAESLGAGLRFTSRSPRGTRVELRIPLNREA